MLAQLCFFSSPNSLHPRTLLQPGWLGQVPDPENHFVSEIHSTEQQRSRAGVLAYFRLNFCSCQHGDSGLCAALGSTKSCWSPVDPRLSPKHSGEKGHHAQLTPKAAGDGEAVLALLLAIRHVPSRTESCLVTVPFCPAGTSLNCSWSLQHGAEQSHRQPWSGETP